MSRFVIPPDVIIPSPDVIQGIQDIKRRREQPVQIPLHDQAPPPGWRPSKPVVYRREDHPGHDHD